MTHDARIADHLARARAAAKRSDWLAALDLAAQALAEDPTQAEAAAIVGAARTQLTGAQEGAAQLRYVTVMVVDLHRSTAIAARLGPELTRELMLELYEVCVDAVTQYEGRVLKYLGDGVMAHFGHPVAHDDDARRAVLAALAVIDAIHERGRAWAVRFDDAPVVRIGIDSGVVAVGGVAAGPFVAQELAGDAPNVATRVQATAEHMTVRITEATHRLVEGWFATEPAGTIELRNYPLPVTLHRVVGPTSARTRLEARQLQPPLLGRGEEQQRLTEAWTRATGGTRQLVTIGGEAGIGKSRLVERLAATATATGGQVLMLICTRLHAVSPLRPVADALARFFGLATDGDDGGRPPLEPLRDKLTALPGLQVPVERSLPLLGALLGIAPAPDMRPEDVRRQTFDLLVDLLVALAADAPLLVCVEDADTADPSTVQLLGALAEHASAPLLLVLTGRTQLPAPCDADDTIELEGLAADHAERLVRHVAPEADDAIVEHVVQRSDGNPFVLEEQARAVHDEPEHELAENGQLSMFLGARLDELGPPLRELVGEIAVAGEEVRLDVVRRMSDASPADVDERIAELCRRRVLVRLSRPSGASIRFRHALLCDAAYGGHLRARRAALHARVASILVSLEPAAAAEDVAHHHGLAGAHEDSARSWLRAARNSADSGAPVEAVEQFRRGLSELVHMPDGPERTALELALQFRLGTVLIAVKGFTSPETRDAFERAMALGEQTPDSAGLVDALYGIWAYWLVLGEHGQAVPIAERAVQLGRQAGRDPAFRWTAAVMVGFHRLCTGDFAGACDELAKMDLEVHPQPTVDFNYDLWFTSRCALVVALQLAGRIEDSRRLARRMLTLVEAIDLSRSRGATTAASALTWLGHRAGLDGDWATSLKLTAAANEIAVRYQYPDWIAASTMHHAIAQCRLGSPDAGLPALTGMLEAWRSAGRDAAGHQQHPILMSPYFVWHMLDVRLAMGDADGSLELVDEVLAENARTGDRLFNAQLVELRARLTKHGRANMPGPRVERMPA